MNELRISPIPATTCKDELQISELSALDSVAEIAALTCCPLVKYYNTVSANSFFDELFFGELCYVKLNAFIRAAFPVQVMCCIHSDKAEYSQTIHSAENS